MPTSHNFNGHLLSQKSQDDPVEQREREKERSPRCSAHPHLSLSFSLLSPSHNLPHSLILSVTHYLPAFLLSLYLPPRALVHVPPCLFPRESRRDHLLSLSLSRWLVEARACASSRPLCIARVRHEESKREKERERRVYVITRLSSDSLGAFFPRAPPRRISTRARV